MDTNIAFTFTEQSILIDALDIAINSLKAANSNNPNLDDRIIKMRKIRTEIAKMHEILYDSWVDHNTEYTKTIEHLKREAENNKIIADHLRRDINDQAKNGLRRGELRQEYEIVELAKSYAELSNRIDQLKNVILIKSAEKERKVLKKKK